MIRFANQYSFTAMQSERLGVDRILANGREVGISEIDPLPTPSVRFSNPPAF